MRRISRARKRLRLEEMREEDRDRAHQHVAAYEQIDSGWSGKNNFHPAVHMYRHGK